MTLDLQIFCGDILLEIFSISCIAAKLQLFRTSKMFHKNSFFKNFKEDICRLKSEYFNGHSYVSFLNKELIILCKSEYFNFINDHHLLANSQVSINILTQYGQLDLL